MQAAEQLRRASALFSAQAGHSQSDDFAAALQRLEAAAERVGQAWCGAWLPGFAHFYDAALTPRGAIREHSGRCIEWAPQAIHDAIHDLAGHPALQPLRERSAASALAFGDAQPLALRLLVGIAAKHGLDERLQQAIRRLGSLRLRDADDLIEPWRPRVTIVGRDSAAPSPKTQDVPAHVTELAEVEALREPGRQLAEVARLLAEAADHLEAKGEIAATGDRAVLQPQTAPWPPRAASEDRAAAVPQ